MANMLCGGPGGSGGTSGGPMVSRSIRVPVLLDDLVPAL